MKVALSSFNFIPHPRDKKRITPEGGDSQSSGIKTYGKFMGWLRSHLGSSAVELKDKHHVWYVKKEDLVSWAEDQGVQKGFDLKQLGQVLENVNKPVNVKVETKPKPIKNEKKPEVKEKATDAEFNKLYWAVGKKVHPKGVEEFDQAVKGLEKAQQENMSEIEGLKIVVSDLENNPNKTEAEKKQLKEFRSRLDDIAGEKINDLNSYLKSLQIGSEKDIGPAVKEWMKRHQAIAKIYDLELSEEMELKVVNNTIDNLSSSKYKNVQKTLPYVLLSLTNELLVKKLK